MSDRLQWLLELQDRLSGPAARMERQLGQVRAQLKALDIAAKQNQLDKITDPLKRQRAELQLQRDRLLMSKAAMEKHGGAVKWLGERVKANREALRDWLLILDPLVRGFHFLAARAEEMGKRIVHAVSFKQGALIGLETMFGKGGGGGIFEQMEGLAGRIGKPIEQLVELARSLALVGARQGDILPMVRLIEDLDAMNPGAGEKLAGVIRGVFSTGFMGVGDIEALRGTMLSPDKLYAKYSKMLGGPGNRIAGKAAIEQLGSAGTGIPKNLGIQMLLDQVLGLEGGQAGSASGRAGLTLEARISRIGIQMESMFGRLSGSRGVKAFGGLLDNLISLFNPETNTGRAMFGRLDALSQAIAKMLDPLTGSAGLHRMETFFARLVELAKAALPAVSALGRGIEYLMKRFAPSEADKRAEMEEALKDPSKKFFRFGTGGSGEISPEEFYGLPGGLAATFALNRRAEIASEMFARESSPFSQRGYAGAEINVAVNVDARGANRDDAEHIAAKAKAAAVDAVTEALDRAATQKGAQ